MDSQSPNTPRNLVDVLSQLPPDVLDRNIWIRTSSADLCSFRAAGRGAAAVCRSSRSRIRLIPPPSDAGPSWLDVQRYAALVQRYTGVTKLKLWANAAHDVTAHLVSDACAFETLFRSPAVSRMMAAPRYKIVTHAAWQLRDVMGGFAESAHPVRGAADKQQRWLDRRAFQRMENLHGLHHMVPRPKCCMYIACRRWVCGKHFAWAALMVSRCTAVTLSIN